MGARVKNELDGVWRWETQNFSIFILELAGLLTELIEFMMGIRGFMGMIR